MTDETPDLPAERSSDAPLGGCHLKLAQLCVECEWIFESASKCPRCECEVLFPVAKGLNREPQPKPLEFRRARKYASTAPMPKGVA